MDRNERQKLSIVKWLKNGGIGCIEAATGYGKTRVALLVIKSLVSKNSNSSIIIVVPTETLKDQWTNLLISWGLIQYCKVEIINSVINKSWSCDLLIIDEVHIVASDTFQRVFDVVDYKMILCLTATLNRIDKKEEIIKKYAPVVDSITLREAEENGWVSPHKEYAVLLDVDLTEYNELNRKFNSYFAYFNWDFNLALNCCSDWKLRNSFAKQMGVQPKEVLKMSVEWGRYMRKRKEFIMSHPKKLEICRKILNARKDKKCLTFSATISDAEAIGIGDVIHSKKSKTKNKKIIEEFNNKSCGVLCSSKSADCGVDISGLSVGVIMSVDSSKIRKTQRVKNSLSF